MGVTGELAIKKRVVEDSSISTMAKALFFYILCQNREKFVFVHRTIMERLNCSKPTFLKAMKELLKNNILAVFPVRERGRIKGARYWVIGIDSIQNMNNLSTDKNTDVNKTDVNKTDVSKIYTKYNKYKEEKVEEEKEEECSPVLANDEQNEIEVVCQEENKTADAVTHIPHETTPFSSSETRTNVGGIVVESARIPTVNDFVQAINDSLNDKGLIWGTSQIQYKAEKLHSYYAGKNWIGSNGKMITSLNVPHLVKYCLTRDEYRPDKAKSTTKTSQVTGASSAQWDWTSTCEAIDKMEEEKAKKEEQKRLQELEQQRIIEEYNREHGNA